MILDVVFKVIDIGQLDLDLVVEMIDSRHVVMRNVAFFDQFLKIAPVFIEQYSICTQCVDPPLAILPDPVVD